MTKIKLNEVVFRDYQIPIVDALENKNFKRLLIILSRRAGKDFVLLQLALRQALRKTCTVFYVFPSYSNARKAVWDAITIDGVKLLDYFPNELCTKNSTEMKITFINGSIIQFIGSTEYDRLRGTNPFMCIFSEYAYQDPMAYETIRPILAANSGVAIFCSTPQGKNHFYDLYERAKNSPEWFVYHKTVDDTKHISRENLEQEKKDMSEDMFLQEFYCSFSAGIEGAYYAKYINNMRLKNQIGTIPWESSFPVYTAWDIGVRDSTTIIFFQTINNAVNIIDSYENSKEGLEHYVSIIKSKPYVYGKHIAPHDIAVKEWGSGQTRLEKAKNLGVFFHTATNIPLMDGIESVRSLFSRLYIDESKNAKLIKALESYRQEWDSKHKIYKTNPLHDASSHYADAMRYLAVSLPKTKDTLTQQDLDKMYQEVYYGNYK